MRPHIDAFGVNTEDAVSVAARGEPSSDLLDRALVGWERFLSTMKREVDE
ncbi:MULTISPECIES: hypothetical protein [unclassified Streptomyces]|nr:MULTISPECIES: hypothetical protein [unclassified Streptomyces]WSR16321.1 hypothetical protein OG457_25480 [Streptomyces sp. NBC_01207]WTA20177.1 hypothetical protein OG365_20165 [Streptomyces sp. NBC_00853]